MHFMKRHPTGEHTLILLQLGRQDQFQLDTRSKLNAASAVALSDLLGVPPRGVVQLSQFGRNNIGTI